MKRIFSVLITLTLLLSLCSTASAADTFNIIARTDTIFIDETLQLGLEDLTGTLDLNGVVYSVNNKNAEVDANGLLVPKRAGSVTVSVRTADKKHHDTFKVYIEARPESIEIKGMKDTLAVGKKLSLSTTMLPKNVNNKKVTWSSSDDTIASVSDKGRLTANSAGTATITATSVLDPSISGSATIQIIQLAKKISFSQKEASVNVTEALPLTVLFEPEGTSIKDLTFTSNRPKIATVSEDGTVTGVKAGKATIKAKTKDGSSKTATIIVHVEQPVGGVRFKNQETRVGVGNYATVTAILEPEDSTNKNMTWQSADESIAMVKGNTNKVRVYAHAWGDTTITGTTEDGGYSASMLIHGGSYSSAIKVRESRVKSNGRISLVFENVSNMDMYQVRFHMVLTKVTDPNVAGMPQPIEVDGKYNEPLYAGERTIHGSFSFKHPDIGSDWICETAITGFTTTDDFRYNLNQERWKYVSTD